MTFVRATLPLLPLLLLACSSSDAPVCGEGALADEGSATPLVVRNNEPYRWVDATLEQTKAAEVISLGDEAPLPAEHPATRWLQAWADEIDTIVRAETAAALGAELQAPKPVLMVIPGSAINAMAASVATWVQEPVGEASTILAVPMLKYPGGPLLLGSPVTTPVPRPASWALDAQLGSYLQNGSGFGEVEVVDGRLDFACVAEGANTGITTFSMTPIIRFTSPMGRRLNEGGALFALAHELAHFYRAHLTPGATPTYWFENAAASTWEPPISARTEAVGLAYRVAAGEPDTGADPALVAEARSNGFSYMTSELQADRLTSYLLTRLGFDGAAQRDAFTGMHTVLGELLQQPVGACAELASNDYRDANGQEVFMPEFPPTIEGMQPSGHPSLCYRGFDLWRQTANSTFSLGTRPALAVGTWEEAKQGL